jgi:hypothetical protein
MMVDMYYPSASFSFVDIRHVWRHCHYLGAERLALLARLG